MKRLLNLRLSLVNSQLAIILIPIWMWKPIYFWASEQKNTAPVRKKIIKSEGGTPIQRVEYISANVKVENEKKT